MTASKCRNLVSTTKVKLCRAFVIVSMLGLCAAIPSFAQQTENEKVVWKLENSYWEYVKALDMDHYKALWHENFVGWPYSSSQPARKDHIMDWIANYTNRGARMQWYSIKEGDSQETENLMVTDYWLTSLWADKTGHGEPFTRVTHTWIKTANGWQIIAGMSVLVPAS
jgi:hypothetical protein